MYLCVLAEATGPREASPPFSGGCQSLIVSVGSFAPTGGHECGPAYLLLAAHGRVQDFFAHGLLDCADSLVPRSIADCLLELRVELANGKAVAYLHLFYRVVKLLLKPRHTNVLKSRLKAG